MKKKIEKITSKLDDAINNLECAITASSKVFKTYVKTILTEIDNDIAVDEERYNYCVTYDGGRHEFDANPFSQIQRIYLAEGKIYLETEDADGLSFDDLDILDQKTVAECLDTIIENEYDLDD